MEHILATWIDQKHLLAEPPTPVSVFPEICTLSPDHCMRTETFKHLLTIARGKLSGRKGEKAEGKVKSCQHFAFPGLMSGLEGFYCCIHFREETM